MMIKIMKMIMIMLKIIMIEIIFYEDDNEEDYKDVNV